MLARFSSSISPSDVIFAGTPLEDNSWLDGIIERAKPANPEQALMHARAKVPTEAGHIEQVLQFSSRYIALSRLCLKSYPAPGEHLDNLRQLSDSTLLISGKESVTDCTPIKVQLLLPKAQLTLADRPEAGNAVILPEAEHNLRGFCHEEVPEVIVRKIPGIK